MAAPTYVKFIPIHSTFGAEVEGIDFSRPVPDSVVVEVQKGIDKHGFLVFRKANLDNESHVAFMQKFGDLDSMPLIRRRGRFPDQPHIFDVSNLDDNGDIIKHEDRAMSLLKKGNELWHADMQYHPRRDKYSMLRAVEIPPIGGETEFADSRTAYDDLSQEMKDKLENVVCECSLIHNRRSAAPDLYKNIDPYDWTISRFKAVYPHEGSGRKNLYVTSYVYRMQGYSIEESQRIIHEVIEHGTQPKYVHRVAWKQAGDAVMWDNTAVWHRALDASEYIFKYRRDMRRTNTIDNGPHAWGENEKGNNWKVKLPQDPLAHESKVNGSGLESGPTQETVSAAA
jgi:alpha-ketoglutarate-dependent 2,4-dichlorophenoxyacetate dioxygenase